MEPISAAAVLALLPDTREFIVDITTSWCTAGVRRAAARLPLFEQLLKAGKLPANHNLEIAARDAIAQALALTGRAIAKYEPTEQDDETLVNYTQDLTSFHLQDKQSLSTLFGELSIDSANLLQITSTDLSPLANQFHPALKRWLQALIPETENPHYPELPPFLEILIKEGFSNPDDGSHTTFTLAFAAHLLQKLKEATSGNDLAALRAFERLEISDLRQLISELPSNLTSSDHQSGKEQGHIEYSLNDGNLQNLKNTIDNLTVDTSQIEQTVKAEADRIMTAINKLQTQHEKTHKKLDNSETNSSRRTLLIAIVIIICLSSLTLYVKHRHDQQAEGSQDIKQLLKSKETKIDLSKQVFTPKQKADMNEHVGHEIIVEGDIIALQKSNTGKHLFLTFTHYRADAVYLTFPQYSKSNSIKEGELRKFVGKRIRVTDYLLRSKFGDLEIKPTISKIEIIK